MPRRRFEITTLRQIEALASPARQEIIDCIESAGPCSASELAELLGKPQDGLYYHIRTLNKLGLLIRAETRATNRRDEIVYDIPGNPMQIRFEATGPKYTRALVRVLASVLRTAERDFEAALAMPEVANRGNARMLNGGRRKGWLTPSELRELNKHLDAADEILRQGTPRKNATLCQLTSVLTPLEPTARVRPTKETP